MIVKPGVYDLPADQYHADPVPGGSLSSSGARKLLPPSCPALFRHWADHEQPHKATFDLGHAAHLLVLDDGPELVVVDAPDWRTKAAREARDGAHAAGKVPLLAADHDRVVAMAAALRRDRIVHALFNPDHGVPERSLFWVDDDTGSWCRARPDWLPNAGRVVVDYKTTTCAAPDVLGRTVYQYGYHQQAAFYLNGVTALGLREAPAFIFVFQEKTPPYLCTVIELDPDALRIGAELNRRALAIYRACVESGEWPSYTADIELIGLPPWAQRQHEETAP